MKSWALDWTNCLLIILAATAACVTPFAVLVIAYVVLGPLHYLTEILWLDQRSYFLPSRKDARWLTAFMIMGTVAAMAIGWNRSVAVEDGTFSVLPYHLQQVAITAALAALLTPLVCWQFESQRQRCLVLAGVILLGACIYYAWDAYSYYLLFAVLIPTVVHVYLFTGIFMLSGALKTRSSPGVLAVVLLVGCGAGLLSFTLPAVGWDQSLFASSYRQTIGFVNEAMISMMATGAGQSDAVLSEIGLRISRFLAFAYIYHYLNWFSKTSVIGWHRLKQFPLVRIVGLWGISVGIYIYDYSLGLTLVGMLSLLHVFYEFPLNWLSMRGLVREGQTLLGHGHVKPTCT